MAGIGKLETPMMPAAPRVFTLDGQMLAAVKTRIAAGEPAFAAPLVRLRREADQALTEGPWSVVEKTTVPPGGDKHDYLSLARYFWPDPAAPDGLPYISRDGEVNPEIFTIPDHRHFDALLANVPTLALAWYLTGEERYAGHAAGLLRTWFLDEETRLNPHLRYAQGIRGLNDGRPTGLIEARELALLVDALGLLAGSAAWCASDRQGMDRWLGEYLAWLVESDLGRAEARQANNHGTYYDAQVAALALYLGEDGLAGAVAGKAPGRIATQIEPDGRQPLELARTLAWHYSLFNLQALYRLARLGEHVGLDVWHFRTPDGRSLRAATDFIVPYVQGKLWNYAQILPQEFGLAFAVLCQAAVKYDCPAYYHAALAAPGVDPATDRVRLLLGMPEDASR